MKLKGIELEGTYKIIYYDTGFTVYDEKDNAIYLEYNNGFWARRKYNKQGRMIYSEGSNGYWVKKEYDEKGNAIYLEDSDGFWSRWKYNEKSKAIYYEDSNGYWSKSEYNEKGNEICYENSYGYWAKKEYDEKGNRIYFEDSNGEVIDKRVKELTIEQIEKILGYKIKIKGNESIDKNTNVEQEGADFYGATKYSEKAEDILFALQVVYGQPKYTYRDFQKMNLSQTEINETLEYVEKKGYNKFSYFG